MKAPSSHPRLAHEETSGPSRESAQRSRLVPLCLLLAILAGSHGALGAAYTHSGSLLAGGGRAGAGPYQATSFLGAFGTAESRSGAYRLSGGPVSRSSHTPDSIPTHPNAPLISQIPNQIIDEDGVTEFLPFTFTDPDTELEWLNIAWSSSNPSLIAAERNLEFGGSGVNRTVRAVPESNQFGSASLTLQISDGVNVTTMSFEIVVRPVNDPPAITLIPDLSSAGGEPVTTEFSIADPDHETASLNIVVQSDNPSLLPDSGISPTALANGRFQLTLDPSDDRNGVAVVTITAADPDAASVRTQFRLAVSPASTPGELRALLVNGEIIVTWRGRGLLQSAPTPAGPWSDLPNAANGYRTSPTEASRFFRLR